ncbi:hypothetical protein JI664_03595 [Rhodobacter sp. NTK016B]|uniref:hypothetical protein n=1 Tax=Rhodobacter sp. NTK016B TaxID=2759676 RepID=UPI001A8C024E|nr:hypothetical protein [Rhodobacter sp. NTK016B]MBN8291041.1 hypothetical protein [Rhodobacter sp. NTK016B]
MTAETNRDRVRRLLLDALGFRFPKKITEAEGRAMLDRIADELAYMTDEALATLARMLRVHGQGSARNFWPDRATFINFAHVCQPLPLEADPKLVSWFASVEGERMVQDGTLVETWDYFEAKRIPPATPQARALVLSRAQEAARRVQIATEKQAAGWAVEPNEAAWVRAYLARRDRLIGLLDKVRAERGATPITGAA